LARGGEERRQAVRQVKKRKKASSSIPKRGGKGRGEKAPSLSEGDVRLTRQGKGKGRLRLLKEGIKVALPRKRHRGIPLRSDCRIVPLYLKRKQITRNSGSGKKWPLRYGGEGERDGPPAELKRVAEPAAQERGRPLTLGRKGRSRVFSAAARGEAALSSVKKEEGNRLRRQGEKRKESRST